MIWEKELKKSFSLQKRLEAYSHTDMYPFHMPGHKRNIKKGITQVPNPFSVDITEIAGFDNLHHPEGILRDAMEKAASIYGADETYFLVNGSTCGILSAICASVRRGGTFIMARNSHKSAYHACLIKDLKPCYVYPEYITKWGIQGGVDPEQVRDLLKENPGAEAVFLTSPTYEGIVSDVETIAEIAHHAGAVLIVDEAHGAHFSFGESGGKRYFPKSAIECGADLVIQSVHKTLPSLTQTALLHVKGNLVDRDRLRRFLQIFQSSSPSYIFLASIENCISYMANEGRAELENHGERMSEWIKRAGGLRTLRLMGDDVCGTFCVKNRDISKVLISTMGTGETGSWLADRLRDQYHLEPEMACVGHVLYMTSLWDSGDGLERLLKALIETDRRLSLERERQAELMERKPLISIWANAPEQCLSIADASETMAEEIDASFAQGRISAGFVTVYPPGIPTLAPGERITREIADELIYCAEVGLTVEGLSAHRTLQVVRPFLEIESKN